MLAAALLSCAYYNIFWTARKEYGKATEQVPYAEFWDPYEQERLSGANLKLLDSAANRSGKVLVLYPDSKWVDDALLLMGKCFLLVQDYDKALTKFREVGTIYSEGELAEEARYLEAYTLVIQESQQEAIPILQDLAANARDELVREKAEYLGARVAFEGDDCLVAVDSYVAYLDHYPEGGRAEQARLALGECLVRLGMYREAIEDLQPLTDELDEKGVMALLRMGKAYRMLGERTEAVGIFEQVLLGVAEDTLRARAGIEQALTYLDEERYEDAIQTLVLADSLGNKKLSGEVNYRIGLIYESDLRDFDEAIVHYEDSVKKKSPYARTAARRSRALKKLNEYQEEIAAGTGDVAKSMYLLAETYLYDLGMREEALAELAAVSDSFPESEYAARSMLALAAYFEEEGDAAATGYYQRVVDNFPETPYANVARIALGMAPVDVAAEEPEPAPPDPSADGVARPDTLSLEGPPRPGPEGPVPGPMPAAGDTLAVGDTTESQRPGPPGLEMLPGLSDSARARYERYMRSSRPPPEPPDSGEGESGEPGIPGEENR